MSLSVKQFDYPKTTTRNVLICSKSYKITQNLPSTFIVDIDFEFVDSFSLPLYFSCMLSR